MSALTYLDLACPGPGQTTQVAPGVHWLRMPLPFALDHINLWLLEDGNDWVIVDSGLKSRRIRECWEEIFSRQVNGARVGKVIVTHYHPDHIGLAGWLFERLGAPLWMSRADYLYCQMLLQRDGECPPDQAVEFYRRAGFDAESLEVFRKLGYASFVRAVAPLPVWFHGIRHGEAIEIGGRIWRALTLSGHSPEHICLFCPELNVLISGDQVLPRISSNISVYPPEPDANPLKDWLESLESLLDLPEDVLVLPSHNEPFFGLHQRVRELQEHHADRLKAVEAACADGPKTAIDLYTVLFGRKINGFEHMFAAGESLAHLHYLMEAGKIRREPDESGVDIFRTVEAPS